MRDTEITGTPPCGVIAAVLRVSGVRRQWLSGMVSSPEARILLRDNKRGLPPEMFEIEEIHQVANCRRIRPPRF